MDSSPRHRRVAVIGLALVCTALLATPVRGQPVADAFPSGCLIYVGWAGAEALEEPFAQTAFGRICAEPSVVRLCGALQQGLAGWLAAQGANEPNFARLRVLVEGLLKYPAGVGLVSVRFGEQGPAPDVALVVRAGENSTTLHRALEALMVEGQAQSDVLSIGAYQLARHRVADMPFPIVTGVIGEHLLVSIGESAARAVVGAIGGSGDSLDSTLAASRAEVAHGTVALYGHVDIPGICRTVESIASKMNHPLPPAWSIAMKEGGFDRVGAIAYGMTLVDNGFREAVWVPIEGGLEPGSPVSDEELRLIPADSLFSTVFQCDLSWWYRTIRRIVDASVDEAMRLNLNNQIGSVEELVGFRIDEDLLANFGTRFVVYEDRMMRSWLPLGFTLILKPKDADGLGRSLGRLVGVAAGFTAQSGARLETRSMETESGTIDYLHIGGVASPVAPAWARKGDLLIFSLLPAGVERCLERLGEGDGGRGTSALASADFQRARRLLPAETSAFEYHDVPTWCDIVYPALLPLVQMGLSASSLAGIDGDASMLPAPHRIRRELFGHIVGSRSDGKGFLFVQHGPLPVSTAVLWSVGSTAMLAGLMVPTILGARKRADAAVQVNNLKQLAVLSMVYADDDKNNFPPSLNALRERDPDLSSDLFESLHGPEPLGYIAGQKSTAPVVNVLIYDPNPDFEGKLAVAYVGMQVMRIPAEEAWKQIETTKEWVRSKKR